jgi:hypothetical protein
MLAPRGILVEKFRIQLGVILGVCLVLGKLMFRHYLEVARGI